MKKTRKTESKLRDAEKMLSGKSIAPILRDMEVDEIQSWEACRFFTISNGIQRIIRQEFPDRKYQMRSNYTVTQVKRIK